MPCFGRGRETRNNGAGSRMISPASGHGRAYRARFSAPAAQGQRTERLLAAGRVYLSAWSLLALALDAGDAGLHARAAQALVAGYFLFAVLLLLSLRARPEIPRLMPLWIHAADVLWATGATALTGGLGSPFAFLFVFTLLTAAYRWGSLETLVTAGAGVALLASQVLVTAAPGAMTSLDGPALRSLLSLIHI